MHAFVVPKGETPWKSNMVSHVQSSLTTYAMPQSKTFSLIGEEEKMDNIETVSAFMYRQYQLRNSVIRLVFSQELTLYRYE